MKFLFKALLPVLLAFPVYGMEFTLQHPEDKYELQTLALLKALRAAHNLENWEFTDKVHIDKTSIPHSHPVLTLHARHGHKSQKDRLLSTYLHEQIHWLVDENIESTKVAIASLKKLFPEVPVGYPEGARNKHSTYLHLIVCYLELTALADYLSEERVTAVLKFWQNDHYTWVYRQVELHRDTIANAMQNSGLYPANEVSNSKSY